MMEDGPRGAILQRDRKTYAIVPRTPAGIIAPEDLENIVKAVRRYTIPVIKMTSGQRMALVGIKEEDVDNVWKELGMTVGEATAPCLHYVQTCPGTETCKYGVQDSLGLGLKLEEVNQDLNLPAKLKMGVSGCPRCCGESYVRDIGLIGTAKGWTVTFGGNSGGRPRIGDVVAKDLPADEAVSMVRRLLEYYRDNGKPGERTPRFAERVGIETVRAAMLGLAPPQV